MAVFGGPDSLFCLGNMRLAGYKIVVAHVNYQKRIDSANDENLVRVYCQKYSVSRGLTSDKSRIFSFEKFPSLSPVNPL